MGLKELAHLQYGVLNWDRHLGSATPEQVTFQRASFERTIFSDCTFERLTIRAIHHLRECHFSDYQIQRVPISTHLIWASMPRLPGTVWAKAIIAKSRCAVKSLCVIMSVMPNYVRGGGVPVWGPLPPAPAGRGGRSVNGLVRATATRGLGFGHARWRAPQAEATGNLGSSYRGLIGAPLQVFSLPHPKYFSQAVGTQVLPKSR